MPQSPEVNQPQEVPTQPQAPEGVNERPSHVELSNSVQSTGVQSTQVQDDPQITDNDGNTLIQSADPVQPAINIPEPEELLVKKSKGDPTKGSTWNSSFILRFVKKL